MTQRLEMCKCFSFISIHEYITKCFVEEKVLLFIQSLYLYNMNTHTLFPFLLACQNVSKRISSCQTRKNNIEAFLRLYFVSLHDSMMKKKVSIYNLWLFTSHTHLSHHHVWWKLWKHWLNLIRLSYLIWDEFPHKFD